MKKRILIVVYALLLCVTVCVAWLSNSRINYVKEILVDFPDGALTIGNPDVAGVIGRIDESGQFQRVDTLTFDPKSMVPGSGQNFQIRLKNMAESRTQKIKLGVAIKVWTPEVNTVADGDAGVTESVNEADVLDMIYLSVIKNASTGSGNNEVENFDSENSISVRLGQASAIGEAKEKTYFLWVCGDGNEIIVPAKAQSDSESGETTGTTESETESETEIPIEDFDITINCSFGFDPDATAEHQNVKIQALAFRVE